MLAPSKPVLLRVQVMVDAVGVVVPVGVPQLKDSSLKFVSCTWYPLLLTLVPVKVNTHIGNPCVRVAFTTMVALGANDVGTALGIVPPPIAQLALIPVMVPLPVFWIVTVLAVPLVMDPSITVKVPFNAGLITTGVKAAALSLAA